MKDHITSDDILGKQAVDPDGYILGVIIKLHISNSTKTMIGITIDQGFLKPDLFVGIDFIRFFGVDAVLLNRAPESKYKGMKVVTEDGHEIGNVKSIIKNKKKVTEFIVQTKGIRKQDRTIPVGDVLRIGERIVLRKEASIRD